MDQDRQCSCILKFDLKAFKSRHVKMPPYITSVTMRFAGGVSKKVSLKKAVSFYDEFFDPFFRSFFLSKNVSSENRRKFQDVARFKFEIGIYFFAICSRFMICSSLKSIKMQMRRSTFARPTKRIKS